MKVSCYIIQIIKIKKKIERNQVEPFVIFITRVELFGLNERGIEEAR